MGREEQVLVTRDHRSDLWKQCAELEASVFVDAGYVDNEHELEAEYEPYRPATFFAASVANGRLAGCARLIAPSDVGLKTVNDCFAGRLALNDFGLAALAEIGDAVEVGTIAVPRDRRAEAEAFDRAAFHLYSAVLSHSVHHETEAIVAAFDADYFERFQSLFGGGIAALGPSTDYMGSATVPALIHRTRAAEHIDSLFPGTKELLEARARAIDFV